MAVCGLSVLIIAMSAVSKIEAHGNRHKSLDASDLYLRRDLLDTATTFFKGLGDMLMEGDLDEWIVFAHATLTDDFIFPSDVSGVTYYGLDEFLNTTSGFHVNIIGTFDSVTSIMGSNIIYSVIDDNTATMEFPVRVLLWRDTCPVSGLQAITEEEIDIMTFEYCQTLQKWKISSYIRQSGTIDISTCST